jgi:asparagine synthase (glutamine-hydrolysing)
MRFSVFSYCPTMAALLGVSGATDPDPEALLRRAAAPVLRRPWHRLETIVDADTGTALGYAGFAGGVAVDQPSGVVAALEGELYPEDGSPVSGTQAALVLLDRYAVDGDALELGEGVYAGAVWDPRRRALVLVTDRHGRRPIYVVHRGTALVVAGELKAVLAAGFEPRIDVEAWAQFLAYEHFLGEYAPLESVQLVPPGANLVLQADGRQELRRRWRYRLEPASNADEQTFLDSFDLALRTAVRRRLDSHTALALSGGIDSRCLAAVIASEAPATPTLTYGVPGSADLELGARIAARLGLQHHSLPLTPGFLSRGVAETVWLSEGEVRCFHVHHLAPRALRRLTHSESLLIGYSGDHVVRSIGGPLSQGGASVQPRNVHRYRAANLTDELAEQVLTPQFASELRGRAASALERLLAEHEGPPLARARQLFFEIQRRKITPGAALFADDLVPRDPYDDLAVIDVCRKMPESFRRGGAIHLAYLRRYPELSSLATTRQGMAPDVKGYRRRVATLRQKAAARAVALPLAFGRAGARRPKLADYGLDLRSSSANLLEILTEERTLDRGQLRGEAVRALIDETLCGRREFTRALGVLLTFELFQRQFVDGDGFAGGGTEDGEAVNGRLMGSRGSEVTGRQTEGARR